MHTHKISNENLGCYITHIENKEMDMQSEIDNIQSKKAQLLPDFEDIEHAFILSSN